MSKLKIVLQSNHIYYFLIFIALILYTVFSNLEHISIYDKFINEKFLICNVTVYDYGIKLNLKGKEKVIGYIYQKNNQNYDIGDYVLITGEKQDITNNTVPNTFNYRKYLNSQKNYNVIKIKDIKKIKVSKNPFYKIRKKLIKRVNSKSSPYINSLIFGNNSYIDDEIQQSYRENGISHLFAISGLHISIFISILTFILKKTKIKRFLINIIIISFLIFYIFLANFSYSLLRTSIFNILKIINKSLDLNITNVKLLILTLIIIIFINPLSINNIGLKYSFTISFFILKYSKNSNLLKISILSFLASYPITVNNFYQINALSIIYNLFFIPYLSLILLPLTMLRFIFPFLENILYFFITIIESLSHFLNSIEIGKINMCKISSIFVIFYFVILWKLYSSKNKKKYVLFLLLFFVINFISPIKKEYFVMSLDVGQGDSTVVSIKNDITMIDTGGSYNSDKISKNKLIPYLKSIGIKKIDTLIITHGDYDHMGEAKYLVENFKVEKVIFNCGPYNDLEKKLIKVLDKKKIKYYSCINELNIDKNKLYFLQTKEYDNENDNSNVIYTELNGYKLMFMGDASITTEKEIMSIYNLPDIDVLKVGHHGSKTSSSIEFINEINPKYSIISVGKNNRYGHPNKEVLNNLKDSKIYRTDEDGSIMFKIKNNKLKIETCSP